MLGELRTYKVERKWELFGELEAELRRMLVVLPMVTELRSPAIRERPEVRSG